MATDMSPAISAAETQRRAQLREQSRRDFCAQARIRLRRKIFSGVRRTFVFLLGAAIMTFVVAHRNQIHALATQKICRVVAHVKSKANAADPLRQSALNYEKEVEEVTGQ
jgi:hypothetical protein